MVPLPAGPHQPVPRRSSFLLLGAQMLPPRPWRIHTKLEMKKNVFFILCLVEEKKTAFETKLFFS